MKMNGSYSDEKKLSQPFISSDRNQEPTFVTMVIYN